MADGVATGIEILPTKGINEDLSSQTPGDLEIALNIDLRNGLLEARRGWTALGAGFETGDPDALSGPHLIDPTFAGLAYEPFMARGGGPTVGMYVARSQAWLPRTLIVRNQFEPTLYVYDGAYRLVGIQVEGGGYLHGAVSLNGAFGEPKRPRGPYVFAQMHDVVYFTAGEKLFAYDLASNTISVAQFIEHPQYGTSYTWVTAGLQPSGIAAAQGRMFYFGFPENMGVQFSQLIPTDDDSVSLTDLGRSVSGVSYWSNRSQGLFFPGQLFWSEPDSPRSVVASNYWSHPEGEPITAVADHDQAVYVFTENTVWAWQAVDEKSVTMRRVYSSFGCVAQRTLQTLADGRLAWLSRHGICVLEGGIPRLITRPKLTNTWDGRPPSTQPVTDGFNRASLAQLRFPFAVDKGRLEWSTAVQVKLAHQYWVTITSGWSPVPNDKILVWDTRGERFWWHGSYDFDNGVLSKPGIAAWDVLANDPRQPDEVFAALRCYSENSANPDPVVQSSSVLAVYGGIGDEVVRVAGARYIRTKARFPVYVSSTRIPVGGALKSVLFDLLAAHHGDFDPQTEAAKATFVIATDAGALGQKRATTDLDGDEAVVRLLLVPERAQTAGGTVLADAANWFHRAIWQATTAAAFSAALNQWNSTVSPLAGSAPGVTWQTVERFAKVVPFPAMPTRHLRWFLLSDQQLPQQHRFAVVAAALVVEPRGRSGSP